MTLTLPVTKVPCPKCSDGDRVVPDVLCSICGGDGMVTPEVRGMYLVKRSGEYRLNLKPQGDR
jgi:hypothetical protein